MAFMNGGNNAERPGPRRWLGIGIRLLATLFFLFLILALSRCAPSRFLVVAPPTATTSLAWLHVEILPEGARVIVNGQIVGPSPLSVELPVGRQEVEVELDGYASFFQIVNLAPGDKAVVSGELIAVPTAIVPTAVDQLPTAVPSTPTPPQDVLPPLPDLIIRYVIIELETGGACDYTSTQLGLRVAVENAGGAETGPFVVEVNGSQQIVEAGLWAGQAITLWFPGESVAGENRVIVDATSIVREINEDNNIVSKMVPIPTLPPTCTPPPPTPIPTKAPTQTPLPPTPTSPPPTATPPPIAIRTPMPAAPVTVREGQIRIPTYPFADFTTQVWSETFNISFPILNWGPYEASNPAPAEITYRTVILENEYLVLTFLPEVGGRLYEVFYKPTGHRVTYRNPVLKPTSWGSLEQGWWLAAGGIEWCLPVEEHGYEWGTPWTVQVLEDDRGATILLRDTTANDRLWAEIAVRLEAGASYFTIRPWIENPTNAPMPLKYWTNALLAPGGRNVPSGNLRFVLPDQVAAVTVHSRGDEFLPNAGERMPWPIVNGVDLSKLGNWNRWLGFFEDFAQGQFMAVYDEAYDEGLVRIFPPEVTKGAKVFAFGWHDPIPTFNWTDDGSSYVEMHGGLASTFDDHVILPAGGSIQWAETWYPLAGLGGLRSANEVAALNLSASGGQVRLAATTTRPWSGDVVLLLNDQERMRYGLALVPGQPFRQTVLLGTDDPQQGRLTLRLEAPGGIVVAEYSAEFNLK